MQTKIHKYRSKYIWRSLQLSSTWVLSMRRRMLVTVTDLLVLLTRPIIPPPLSQTLLTNSDCCLFTLCFLSSSCLFSSSYQIRIQMEIQLQMLQEIQIPFASPAASSLFPVSTIFSQAPISLALDLAWQVLKWEQKIKTCENHIQMCVRDLTHAISFGTTPPAWYTSRRHKVKKIKSNGISNLFARSISMYKSFNLYI